MSLPVTAYIVVFAAILIPGGLYFFMAAKERTNILDITDFFPLQRSITSNEYRSTTVAAGMSLATVIVAFINLAPFLGMTLMVSVITYSCGFLLLYPCIDRILNYNTNNDTIQTYLGKVYESSFVRHTALFFSLIGYVSIFCMELIVGVTVLQPFLGTKVIFFAGIYLVFILIYSWMSGYRAIISTDKWQLRFIVAGILALVVFGFIDFSMTPTINLTQVVHQGNSWPLIWSFIIGITVMNLPAPISDAGTWQRLCSTRSPAAARQGLRQVVPLFVILWTALVCFGVFYAPIAQSAHNFDPSKEALISVIITQLSSNHPGFLLLLFVFFLGLFSAMISTADSLLIVSGQILAIDIMKIRPNDRRPDKNLRKARLGMASLAIIAFALFSTFYLAKLDVVQLVFAIYGAQLAMFPTVFASLFLRKKLRLNKIGIAASLSILSGFCAGWGSAIYGKISNDTFWLYNAPVSALCAAICIFTIAVILTPKKTGAI